METRSNELFPAFCMGEYARRQPVLIAASLPTTQTSWQAGTPLSEGVNYQFNLTFGNSSNNIVASTPLDALSNAFPGWSTTSQFSTFDGVSFQVETPTPAVGHLLIGQYSFDNTNYLGMDDSIHDNGVNCYSYWGSRLHEPATNSVDGGWALQFSGFSSLTPCSRAFRDWQAALLGSFSVSVWINTTNQVGADDNSINDLDYQSGQAVVFMDQQATIPIGLTGSKVAFATSDGSGSLETLHSATSVTTGRYVHVVVTRDAVSGTKKIYINGVLDSTETGIQGRLGTGATSITLGSTVTLPYTGLLDEVQIYRGVLQDADVAKLYADPSATIPDVLQALPGTLVAHYTFDDTNHLGLDTSGNIFDLNFADSYNVNFSSAEARMRPEPTTPLSPGVTR